MDIFFEQAGEALAPIFGTFNPILIGRLLLVLMLCGMIGLERSGHERASGFRPHILVGLGACLMTMAGAYAFPEYIETRDPMRVASYVVSGIGFLGAGAILRHGTMVRGLTTAASIWCAAGLGIAVGVGLGWLAIVTALFILFTLMILENLEERLSRNAVTNELKIHLKDADRAVGKALTALDRLGMPIKRAVVSPGMGSSSVLRVELSQPLKYEQIARLVKQLLVVKSIQRVDTTGIKVDSTPEPPRKELPVVEDIPVSEAQPLDDDTLLQDLNDPEGNHQEYVVMGESGDGS